MKYLITIASLALMAGTALAAPAGCNPSQGNWVNAATFSCAKSDTGGDKYKRPEAEVEATSPAA